MIEETNVRNAQKTALIISFSFIFTLGIYAGIAEFVLGDSNPISVPSYTRFIFMAIAAVEVILMVIIKNRIISGENKFPSHPAPLSIERTEQPDSKIDSPEEKEREFINRLRTAHIVTYALCESIAIYGLVLFILQKDKTEFYAFLGVALFLMLVHFPKYDDWKSRLEDFLSDY